MLRIDIIAVGRLKEDYLVKGAAEYQKRLSPYAKVNVSEVADEPIPPRPSPGEIRKILAVEGGRILAYIKEGAFLIALDPKGVSYSSEEMAVELLKPANAGVSKIAFVIGGSLGLDEKILARASLRLSFSKLTFPHQLFRVMLLEQLYRWLRISRNEPYHL
jgi:23S rRNA (pseudouridine1915-N3)-methyltransferase